MQKVVDMTYVETLTNAKNNTQTTVNGSLGLIGNELIITSQHQT